MKVKTFFKEFFCAAWLVIFSLVSCNNQEGNGFDLDDLVIDTINIQLPIYTSANLIQPFLWTEDEFEWLVGYNYLDHSISVFNLTKRQYFKQIKLEENGPNFVDTVSGIAFYGANTLILSSVKYITLINFDGKVLDRIRLNNSSSELNGFDFTSGRMDVIRHSGLQFESESGEILLGAVKREYDGQVKKYIAAINISTRAVRLIDLPDFESRKKGERFGNIEGFSFNRIDDGLIVNPRFSSELVLLDDGQSRYYVNSSFVVNKSAPFTNGSAEYSNIIEHQNSTVEFFPVFRTFDKKMFFRIHKGGLDKVSQKQPFFLIYADKGFNKLHEQSFPESYYIIPIISKEGLMFMAFNKHDDKLELIRYRFNEGLD